jgi:hypothetical protein
MIRSTARDFWVSTMSPTELVIHVRQPIPTTRRMPDHGPLPRRPDALAALAVLTLALTPLALTVAPAYGLEAGTDATAGAPGVPRSAQGPPLAATMEEILGEAADPLGQIERQIQAEEFDPAIRELEQRIETIAADNHRFDTRLVRPLTLLGDAYAGLDQFETALGHYQRALHLSRVNQGLNTPEQVEIVYREADTPRGIRLSRVESCSRSHGRGFAAGYLPSGSVVRTHQQRIRRTGAVRAGTADHR